MAVSGVHDIFGCILPKKPNSSIYCLKLFAVLLYNERLVVTANNY